MKKQAFTLFIGILIGALMFGSVAYASKANINVSFEGIKIFITGEERQPEAQPFVYNGRTFVPLRFISEALGETVEWDAKNKSIYIGGRPEGSFLTDIIKPYDSEVPGIYHNKIVEIGNDKYYKTIDVGRVSYNLKGQFKRFALLVTSPYGEGWLKISGDNNTLWEGKFKREDLPIPLDLDVTGIEKLKFEGGWYTVLNPKVYP